MTLEKFEQFYFPEEKLQSLEQLFEAVDLKQLQDGSDWLKQEAEKRKALFDAKYLEIENEKNEAKEWLNYCLQSKLAELKAEKLQVVDALKTPGRKKDFKETENTETVKALNKAKDDSDTSIAVDTAIKIPLKRPIEEDDTFIGQIKKKIILEEESVVEKEKATENYKAQNDKIKKNRVPVDVLEKEQNDRIKSLVSQKQQKLREALGSLSKRGISVADTTISSGKTSESSVSLPVIKEKDLSIEVKQEENSVSSSTSFMFLQKGKVPVIMEEDEGEEESRSFFIQVNEHAESLQKDETPKPNSAASLDILNELSPIEFKDDDIKHFVAPAEFTNFKHENPKKEVDNVSNAPKFEATKVEVQKESFKEPLKKKVIDLSKHRQEQTEEKRRKEEQLNKERLIKARNDAKAHEIESMKKKKKEEEEFRQKKLERLKFLNEQKAKEDEKAKQILNEKAAKPTKQESKLPVSVKHEDSAPKIVVNRVTALQMQARSQQVLPVASSPLDPSQTILNKHNGILKFPKMPDEDDDSEPDNSLIYIAPKIHVPKWASTPALKEKLLKQQDIDPEAVFGEVKNSTIQLESVFDQLKEKAKIRGSSANWSKDLLTKEDAEKYSKIMGYKNDK